MRYYAQYGGGGFDDGRLYFSGVRRQRGSGLGGIFGTVARHLIPFFKRFILPHAASAVSSIASDIALKKQPLSASIKEHGKQALKRAGSDILNQSGSGKRRKRESTKRSPKRKKGQVGGSIRKRVQKRRKSALRKKPVKKRRKQEKGLYLF